MDHTFPTIPFVRKPLIDIADPKDDIFEQNERIQRRKLACLFRLLSYYNWDSPLNNHISVRLKDNIILTAPSEFMAWEITSYNLKTIELGLLNNENNNIHPDYKLDSIVFKYRTDVNCVVHLQAPCVLAVSTMVSGLLPLSKDSLMLKNICYYTMVDDIDESETRNFVNLLGPVNKVMMLKNYGMLIVAKSIEEAFSLILHSISACEIQIKCLKYDTNMLLMGKNDSDNIIQSLQIPIEIAEFEAHIRLLERLNCFTGYPWDLLGSNPKNCQFIPQPIHHKIIMSDSNVPCLDSGVATMTSVDGCFRCSLGYIHNTPSIFEPDVMDEPVPLSESTKELQLREAVIQNDFSIWNHTDINENVCKITTPIPRRLRPNHKSRALIRRSKSLTSGVERAIFRKQSEKILSDRRM